VHWTADVTTVVQLVSYLTEVLASLWLVLCRE
jgi:hypothetical protein